MGQGGRRQEDMVCTHGMLTGTQAQTAREATAWCQMLQSGGMKPAWERSMARVPGS